MKRTLLAVALAAMLVLAGCSSSGTGSTPTETMEGTPTDGDATTAGDSSGTTADSGSASTTSSTGGSDAAAVRSSVVESLDSVETYRVRTNQSVTLAGPVQRNQSVQRVTVVDLDDRSLRRSATIRSMGRTVNSTAYVVDRTLYLRSQANLRRYSSEWVQIDIADNFSRYWRTQDQTKQLELVLTNASSTTLVGTETVDGTQVRILRVEVDPEAYGNVLGGGSGGAGGIGSNLTVHRATFVVHAATDTNRPLLVESDVDYSLQIRGRTSGFNVSTTYEYEYGVDASFALPEAARNAPNASSGGSGPRIATGGNVATVEP